MVDYEEISSKKYQKIIEDSCHNKANLSAPHPDKILEAHDDKLSIRSGDSNKRAYPPSHPKYFG